MKVIKRNGSKVNFNPNKITARLRNQSKGLKVDADEMSIKVIGQMSDNITTRALDNLCVEALATKVPSHPDYGIYASRLFITSLRKDTEDTFSGAMIKLDNESDLLSERFINFVADHDSRLDKMIVQDRDFSHDIFGLKTLEKSYLLRNNKKEIVERPQYMWLRTAIEVSGYNIDRVQETYDAMSEKYYTHATPTLFNSGTKLSQLSSCFLIANKGDSIDGLFDTMKDIAKISKLAGGIGLSIHGVRAKGSMINGTNGESDGILPMMKTYNEIARWINQGGKRKGSFAMYIEPWHADIFEFIELRKNHGKEEMRARDLFNAMWIPDEFMSRVENDEDWHLFCPNELLKEGLVFQELVGEDFEEAYRIAVEKKLYRRKIKARELWDKILVSQMETGTPYIGYKDRVNIASNQKNLGVIQSSNLCIEINEFTSKDEQAVCNLASIALNRFLVKDTLTGKYHFDYGNFREKVMIAVKNLDNVIDSNYYPTDETEVSNLNHRPVGLGVQGLADVFAMMKLPFDSKEARDLNKNIFEHMYFYALEASMEMAKEKGKYSSFEGSPASKGELQFDMYDEDVELDPSLDWKGLKEKIKTNGLRNSLLIALMPTASTSQILGNNECFEPFTSNLYTRRVLSGEFVLINKHLVEELDALGLWNESMKNDLMRDNGSVMNNPKVPNDIKEVFKTAYELSMKPIIDMASDRQKFVCQAQSMNLFMQGATFKKLSSMHFYAWKNNLKTGMYYLRSKSAVDAKKFTVQRESQPVPQEEFKKMIEQSRQASQDDDDCLMCGS